MTAFTLQVGSLRVVLNTKLFPAMVCEKANEKNVRISAMEEGEVRLEEYSCSSPHLSCVPDKDLLDFVFAQGCG